MKILLWDKTKIVKFCVSVAAALILCAIIVLFVGVNKVTEYEAPTSERFAVGGKNAYVGGDAYNYIINGTYFSGCMAISGACLTSSVLMVGTAFICSFLPDKKLESSSPEKQAEAKKD